MSTIGSNIAALKSLHNLRLNEDGFAKATERLSSGKRLNNAGDDAAGGAGFAADRTQRCASRGDARWDRSAGNPGRSVVDGGVGRGGVRHRAVGFSLALNRSTCTNVGADSSF